MAGLHAPYECPKVAAVPFHVGGVAVWCQCAVNALAAQILPSIWSARLPALLPGAPRHSLVKAAVNNMASVLTQCSQASGLKH